MRTVFSGAILSLTLLVGFGCLLHAGLLEGLLCFILSALIMLNMTIAEESERIIHTIRIARDDIGRREAEKEIAAKSEF